MKKAINILWDADSAEELENLPTEMIIPEGMTDEDEVSDYLSDEIGYCHKGFDLVDMEEIEFNVNNQRKIQLTQTEPDGAVTVTTWEAERNGVRDVESEYQISPGDFVMMLNWYRYQKENGNPDLNF